MTDRALRQLDRIAVQGDLDDQARHLLARVRAGDLARGRLELAAWVGDPAARRIPSVSDRALHLIQRGHSSVCSLAQQDPPASLHERALRVAQERMSSKDWALRLSGRHMHARVLEEGVLALRWPGIPPASTCPVCLVGLRFEHWLRGLNAWPSTAPTSLRLACEAVVARVEAAGHARAGKVIQPASYTFWIRTGRDWLTEQVVREAIRDAVVPWALASEGVRPRPRLQRRPGRRLASRLNQSAARPRRRGRAAFA